MEYLWMLLIGLAGGLAGGLLGVGGGIVIIPLLTFMFGPRQHLHQAAVMIVNCFVGALATVEHLRVRAVIGPVVRRLMPAAGVCVAAGVLASELPMFRGDGRVYLTAVFGTFLLGVAADDLRRFRAAPDPHRSQSDQTESTPPRPSTSRMKRASFIGAVTGLLGGLLGLGGGFIAVPLQQRLLHLPIRNAIANSAATVVVVSAIGAVLKIYALVTTHGHPLGDPLRLAAVLIPGAVVGSLIGSRLTHVLPVRWIHVVFIAFLFAAAGRMILYALS